MAMVLSESHPFFSSSHDFVHAIADLVDVYFCTGRPVRHGVFALANGSYDHSTPFATRCPQGAPKTIGFKGYPSHKGVAGKG
jgi:hypothetical protein